MGGGNWDTDVYVAKTATRRKTGVADFDYSARAMAAPVQQRKAHADLDPMGVVVRESRDSAEHPTSVGIAVMFDVTGSMYKIPGELQQRLPALLELLLRKAYVPDPQILFGAFADHRWQDKPAVQISQFESDVRMDDHLRNVVLTGGGGGGVEESYELVLYFFAKHTALDCWEKRQHKGYLVLIGDEMPYRAVSRRDVKAVFGDDIPKDIPLEDIMAEVQERYHVIVLRPVGAQEEKNQDVIARWQELVGAQNVLDVDIPSIAETIAVRIGLTEKSVDLADAEAHMRENGSTTDTIAAVMGTLAGASA